MRRRKVEDWARLVIECETGRDVVLHDDNSQPGMYDFRIGSAAAPDVAIECVGAVDAVRTETWNVMRARAPRMLPGVRGRWVVELQPDARINRVEKNIEKLLMDCATEQIVGFTPVSYLPFAHRPLFDRFKEMGIASVCRIESEGAGRSEFTMNGIGGAIDSTGYAVPGWISDFLRASEKNDVICKLQRSGAPFCEVFVPVDYGGAPWAVESYLWDLDQILPVEAPDLPEPVTGVWIVYGPKGLRWDASGWRVFQLQQPPS